MAGQGQAVAGGGSWGKGQFWYFSYLIFGRVHCQADSFPLPCFAAFLPTKFDYDYSQLAISHQPSALSHSTQPSPTYSPLSILSSLHFLIVNTKYIRIQLQPLVFQYKIPFINTPPFLNSNFK